MHAPATVASFLLSENAGSQSAAYLPALYGEQCAIGYFKKGARSSGACIRDERCGGRMIRPWHASCFWKCRSSSREKLRWKAARQLPLLPLNISSYPKIWGEKARSLGLQQRLHGCAPRRLFCLKLCRFCSFCRKCAFSSIGRSV